MKLRQYTMPKATMCVPHTGNFTTDLSQYGYGHTCVLVGVWVWDSRHNTLNRRV
jgi:hypothetical protein